MVAKSLLPGVAFLLTSSFAYTQPESPPNIIFILIDDQDMDQIGAYGADVYTPNMDRLAAEGIKFNNAYVSSTVCTPSRYSFLTGRYAGNSYSEHYLNEVGTDDQGFPVFNMALEEDHMNVATILASAGYITGFTGKYHLTSEFDQSDLYVGEGALIPGYHEGSSEVVERSPEVSAIFAHNEAWGRRYLKHIGFDWAKHIYEGNLARPYQVHNPEWNTRAAIEFIEENKDNPFFLQICPTLLHGPINQWVNSFSEPNITGAGEVEVDPSVMQRRIELRNRLIEQGYDSESEYWGYAWIDMMIGEILDNLEELNISDNTLVIYTADHGSDMKASLFNINGTQVPFLMRWPAYIPAGIETDAMMQNIDMAPTYFDIVNATSPEGYQIDGISLLPLLKTGETPEWWREHLYFELGNARAVMTNDGWKYIAIRYPQELIERIKEADYSRLPRLMSPIGRLGIGIRGTDHPGFWDEDQLYHLDNDPREMTNLACQREYFGKLEGMQELLRKYIHEIGRPFGEFMDSGNAGLPGQLDKEIAMVKQIRFSGKDVILPDVTMRNILVTASVSQETAPNAIDGDNSTHWVCSGDGEWIQFDFCQEETIHGVKIAFRRGNLRKAIFEVEVSLDGNNWNKVITDGESSGAQTELETFPFPEVIAKYLRITGYGNSDNRQNHYANIEFMFVEEISDGIIIQADDYYDAHNMRIFLVDDCDGFLGINDINDSAWASYQLEHVPDGSYLVQLRIKPLTTGSLEIRVNDQPGSTIPVNEEMVHAGWITVEESIVLPPGVNTLSLHLHGSAPENMIQFNWLKLLLSTGNIQVRHENSKSFTLYPNPGRDIVQITSSDEIKQVSMLDYAGRIVFERPVNDMNLTVPVANLNKGVYLVRIHFNDRVEYCKFIKV